MVFQWFTIEPLHDMSVLPKDYKTIIIYYTICFGWRSECSVVIRKIMEKVDVG